MYSRNNSSGRARPFSSSGPRFRPSTGGQRGGFSRGRSNGRKGFSVSIDPSRFINKAVSVEEAVSFVPTHTFKDFAVDQWLKQAIEDKGYQTPTPIQDQSIPHILNGNDIVGIAETGTGKTAAFLIPLLHKVGRNDREKVLIVVPTRELAIQINDELRDLVKKMRIFSVCVVGGMSIGRQIADLRHRYNFIIGTPGRLKDLIDRGCIELGEFNTIVMDEADRMLDMGFVGDMRFLMSRMPTERQALFFSATVSREIEGLINEFFRNPVRISVKTRDTSKNVDQDVIRVMRGADKLDMLHDLLIQEGFSKVLVFGRTKHGVEKLSVSLNKRGFKSVSIHGDKNHAGRQRALTLFKQNHAQIMVATDVAARGLDIVDVSHVINFELPATYEDYVHRIGRTGRGNKRGKALTFVE